MENLYKVFTIIMLSITIMFGILSFTEAAMEPEPLPSPTFVASGDGFKVYRVGSNFVVKSTDSYPVAITR